MQKTKTTRMIEKRGKIDLLLHFCKWKRVFSKADVIEWGRVNYYLSAERRVREFVDEGLFRKIDQAECVMRGLTGNMAYYEIN